MGKITVITPTIRPEGLEIVDIALKRQTFRDFEWLVVTPLKLKQVEKYISVPMGVVIETLPKHGKEAWTLNRDYNAGIRVAQGELIVSWQDYTFADPDCLEKFWFHYKNNPKHLVSGVGNKYLEVYPTLGEQTWQDPRINNQNGTYYECYPVDWEANFASCPKKAFYEIGGYDEYLDRYFSMDNISVVERIDSLGKYRFFLDQTLLSYSLPHGRPKNWDRDHAMNGQYVSRKKRLIETGVWPKLGYL